MKRFSAIKLKFLSRSAISICDPNCPLNWKQR
jgi:hypothetical protein